MAILNSGVCAVHPLSGLFLTHADFFYRNAYNHETKQASKFQSDPMLGALIAKQSTFEK